WVEQTVSGITGIAQGIGNRAILLSQDGHLHTYDGVNNWVEQTVSGIIGIAQGIGNQAILLSQDGHIHTYDGVHNWVDQTGAPSLPARSPIDLGNGIFHLDLQAGVIYWSAATGAHAVLGSPGDANTFLGRFAASGSENCLGLPVGERVDHGN